MNLDSIVLCLVRQSCLLFSTPWTATQQAPLSMGFSRQEYWSGLPCPPPGHLPNPGIEPKFPALQVGSLPSEPPGKPKNTGVGPIPSPGDLLDPGSEQGSPALQADSLPAELPGKPRQYYDVYSKSKTNTAWFHLYMGSKRQNKWTRITKQKDIGRTGAEAETTILWPLDVKNWLIGKDPDSGKDWRQEEKGRPGWDDWHHWLDGQEFEQALAVGDRQGILACCSLWGHKESDMTEWLNWTELNRNRVIDSENKQEICSSCCQRGSEWGMSEIGEED